MLFYQILSICNVRQKKTTKTTKKTEQKEITRHRVSSQLACTRGGAVGLMGTVGRSAVSLAVRLAWTFLAAAVCMHPLVLAAH